MHNMQTHPRPYLSEYIWKSLHASQEERGPYHTVYSAFDAIGLAPCRSRPRLILEMCMMRACTTCQLEWAVTARMEGSFEGRLSRQVTLWQTYWNFRRTQSSPRITTDPEPLVGCTLSSATVRNVMFFFAERNVHESCRSVRHQVRYSIGERRESIALATQHEYIIADSRRPPVATELPPSPASPAIASTAQQQA